MADMNDITVTLIEKYLSGRASPEEKAEVEAWYQSCLDRSSSLNEMDEAEQKQLSEKMWRQISGAVSEAKEKVQGLPVKI